MRVTNAVMCGRRIVRERNVIVRVDQTWRDNTIGTVNVLATRFWPSGLLLLVGQVVLLHDFLPLVAWQAPREPAALVGLGLCIAALALVVVGWPGRPVATLPLDRVWLDFRDMFGAVWGLRIVERLRAAAARGETSAAIDEVHGWALMGINVFLGLRFGVMDDDRSLEDVARIANALVRNGLGGVEPADRP